jgi:hypothetical protein
MVGERREGSLITGDGKDRNVIANYKFMQLKKLLFIFSFSLLLLLVGCSTFEQNDFIVSKTILTEANEKIYYNVYKIGIDNYRFEFVAANISDTTKLFEYYLNDAVYTAMKLSSSKTGDTLKIKTNFPTEKIIAKTKNKTIVILTN